MRPALLTLALLAALPATAQMPVAGSPSIAKVVAGTYKVDSGHTQVLFTVNHLGFSQYTGQFVQPTGSMTIDPRRPEATRVEIVFPIAKVSTTVSALDAHLRKADFFDAEKYPEGRFVSTRVSTRGTNATIEGNLTLRGVTRPVVLDARFIGAGPNPMSKRATIGFAATTTIKRSDFGINYGIPAVSDRVDLVINAAFEQE
jgi:polyisoprenoid-binding protein YceI